ncbi:unnamed protein product [Prunus armeniaca]
MEEESMKLKDMLDIFHDAGLGYWYFVSSGLCLQAIGYFPKLLGHFFSLMLTHMFRLKKWARVLVLPSNPKLPLLGPSMGPVNARNHPYHNPLSKLQAFTWLGPT